MTIQIASKFQQIQRQNGNGETPRFLRSKRDFTAGFGRLIDLFHTGRLKDVPLYKPDSRVRDGWLQEWRLKETLMAGVINSVVNIDANRGWTITGGRNLVNKWSNRVKDDSASGAGWRHFAKKASLSFWTTDLGNVTGTRRDVPFGGNNEQSRVKSQINNGNTVLENGSTKICSDMVKLINQFEHCVYDDKGEIMNKSTWHFLDDFRYWATGISVKGWVR